MRFLYLEIISHIKGTLSDECVSILRRDKGDLWTLKDNLSFHLYTSSAPCGNCCVRKWVKGKEERFNDSLGTNGWPECTHVESSKKRFESSEGALLLKGRDGMEEEEWVPAGVRPLREGDCKAYHSCSDKILRWQVRMRAPPPFEVHVRFLFFQVLSFLGTLLQDFISDYSKFKLDSVTVGRKFLRAAMERGLCCRMSDKNCNRGRKRSRDDNEGEGGSGCKVKHVSLMRTSVKLDESVFDCMKGEKAIFEGYEQEYWYRGLPLCVGIHGGTGVRYSEMKSEEGGAAWVVMGLDMSVLAEGRGEKGEGIEAREGDGREEVAGDSDSWISSLALFKLYSDVKRLLSKPEGKEGVFITGKDENEVVDVETYRKAKKAVVKAWEEREGALRSPYSVLGAWVVKK